MLFGIQMSSPSRRSLLAHLNILAQLTMLTRLDQSRVLLMVDDILGQCLDLALGQQSPQSDDRS